MPVGEGVLKVTCDECGYEEEAEMPLRYPDYSGRGAFYSIEATRQNLEKEGWALDDEDGATCPECSYNEEGDGDEG